MESYHDMNKHTEIPEAKSLRGLALVFPKIENPADDCDRLTNCINLYCTNAANLIESQRDELIKQEYTLTGVMHSVDKWLDGDELEQDEVNRAITMREKTLRIVENLQAEVERLEAEKDALIKNYAECMKDYAREIFEELEKKARSIYRIINRGEPVEWDMLPAVLIKMSDFEELKKKYTEVSK